MNLMGQNEMVSKEWLMLEMPKNCRISYCVSYSDWSKIADNFENYANGLCAYIYMLLCAVMLLMGLFCPWLSNEKSWKHVKICSCMPLEGLILIIELIGGSIVPAIYLAMWVGSGTAVADFSAYVPDSLTWCLIYGVNILGLTVLFFLPWYLGICLRALKELGIREYIRERSLIYRIFPYVKRKYHELYEEASHYDVTVSAKRLIAKIVLVNCAVLLICCIPGAGIGVAIVYSVLLYFILKKYISGLQEKYRILLDATNEIAEGNLNVSIQENLGVFEPFKPQIIRIQNGFKKAVEEEVKSQRMKSELITNVSHDLKTPLTAIITYVSLLKENITEEQRREYLDTLERKSLRLKVLIEDLFEVSKANSQNITLHIMDLDIVNLLKQVVFEMEDKLKEQLLDVRMELPEEKVILSLDSQKTYRIFENLIGNVAKYALNGTRVYIQCQNTDKEISIIIKSLKQAFLFLNNLK